jgi:hypothetical protein
MNSNAIPLLGIPGASTVSLTPADFRNSLDRTVAKTSDTPSTLTTESPREGQVASITHGVNT